MNDLAKQLSQSHDVSAKVAQLVQTRTKLALDRFNDRVKQACDPRVAEVTAKLHSKFGPASPRYFAAKRVVSAKHRLGELKESLIYEYARSHKMEETIAGLALLCSAPSDLVERAFAEKSRELLLLLAKAADFSWDTTMALLFLGAPDFRITSGELERLKDRFERLQVSSSREVLARYRVRRIGASPAALPDVGAPAQPLP